MVSSGENLARSGVESAASSPTASDGSLSSCGDGEDGGDPQGGGERCTGEIMIEDDVADSVRRVAYWFGVQRARIE